MVVGGTGGVGWGGRKNMMHPFSGPAGHGLVIEAVAFGLSKGF